MVHPPAFQRSPRFVPELPEGELEIPRPPNAPAAPTNSLLTILFPILGTLVGMSVMYFVMRSRPGGFSPMYFLYSLPMMAISYGVSIFTFAVGRRTYHKLVKAREAKYMAIIAGLRGELQQARDQQLQALHEIHPEPLECVSRVEHWDSRLWERSPQDPDFLSVRVGVGEMPALVSIKAPRQEITLDPDPLFEHAQQLANEYRQVSGVPICFPLGELGNVGVAGPRAQVLDMVRAIAVQLATVHSPDELKIVALFPEAEASVWSWLRWLPHVWSEGGQTRYLASTRDDAHDLLTDLLDLLLRRRMQAGNQGAGPEGPVPVPRYIFLLGDPALVENEAILPLLLREGRALGAAALVLAGRKEELPQDCRAVVNLSEKACELVTSVPKLMRRSILPDGITVEQAERLARRMAPLRLRRMASHAELPSAVPLMELFDHSKLEGLDALSRWRNSQPQISLAVPIGIRAGGEKLLLDLHEKGHGPHGLVAGATGSGKSELLQAIIASLALSFHPHEVAFVLVDYKGGGTANVFEALPHLIGTITNLQGQQALRALSALKGELKRRQTDLGRAGVNHIDDYQRLVRQGRGLQPMPHLILIVDEFAELKREQPEFMRELISAVRVGRSLGVHLILATQKPAGVVDEQIWGNARFRLCLRVERPEDSKEVLKRPDAAMLTRPGRAYFQVGNDERFDLFQAGYGGTAYVSIGGPELKVAVPSLVAMNGARLPLSSVPRRKANGNTRTQLQAVVEHLAAEARRAGIERLPSPWLPNLPEAVSLDELRAPEGQARAKEPWLAPVVGLVDDPEGMYQGPLRLPLGREGHAAVYGAPGTGKTTFLQTLAASLVTTHTPLEVNLYILDFGGRSLRQLAPLPHVGGVILPDETERIIRLQRLLLGELERRKNLFAQAGLTTLSAFRESGVEPMPAIVVLIDNWQNFIETYPDAEETFVQVTREGGNLGIHLVATANTPGAIRGRVSSNIKLAVALNLAGIGDYSMAVGRTGGLEPAPYPGRALIKDSPPLEFQTALPVPGATELERSAALRRFVEATSAAWNGPRVRQVRELPTVAILSEILAPGDSWRAVKEFGPLSVPVGLDVESLDPFMLDLVQGPHFLVAGGYQTGKTTLLQTLALALAERYPPGRVALHLVDFRAESFTHLEQLPHAVGGIVSDDVLLEQLATLDEALQTRCEGPVPVIIFDNYDTLRDGLSTQTKALLEQMIRRERSGGLHVIVAGASRDLATGYDGWLKAVKELGTGFLMGSTEPADGQVFGMGLPAGNSNAISPLGRGLFIRKRQFQKIKVATPETGESTIERWVRQIASRRVGE